MKSSSELQTRSRRSRHGGITVLCLLNLLLALLLWPGSAFAQGNSAPLLTTFTDPVPTAVPYFGGAVAAMGSDRVLIGAEYTGEPLFRVGQAQLFSLDGTLLTTFTGPDPTGEGFGASVAAVGNDRLVIGAYGDNDRVGAAYLFTTNGTLLATITNPAPVDVKSFGWSVSAVGSDRVLIAGVAIGINPGPYLRSVFLFSTNGMLVTTFTNPPPADDLFANTVAAMGSDRVLLGAPGNNKGAAAAGSAYLFSTNGALLTTFTNPVPVINGNFGSAVAAVGSDRVLISGGGRAYLFTTNGTLLTTFTNPTPAAGDAFGCSVAAVGNNRVIIGDVEDDTGGMSAGAAYLFSTNGTLIATITKPTPALGDGFGYSVAAVGSDRVIIGAVLDDTGGADAGAAYLFALPYPPLSIARNAGTVSVSWVTAETGLNLQQSDLLGTSNVWSNTTDSVSINGPTNIVQPTIANGTINRFYRLYRP